MNVFRKRIITKLSQQTAQSTVNGYPPNLDVYSLNPNITNGYKINTNIITYISYICRILNSALFYTSNGDKNYTFANQYRNGFNSQYTGLKSQDMKHIIDFSKQVFQQIFKNNDNFQQPLTAKQIYDSILILENSSPLNSIPTTNSSSQLSTNIGGDVKTKIREYLAAIKRSIPAGVAQPLR